MCKYNCTFKIPLHQAATVVDQHIGVVLSFVNHPPCLVIADACILKSNGVAVFRSGPILEKSRLFDESESAVCQVDLVVRAIDPGCGVVRIQSVVLAGVAIVDWMVASHHPPRPPEVAEGHLLADGDVVGAFAGVGDGREVHAVMHTQTGHEVGIGLAGVQFWIINFSFVLSSSHLLQHWPTQPMFFLHIESVKHAADWRLQCAAKQAALIGSGAFLVREAASVAAKAAKTERRSSVISLANTNAHTTPPPPITHALRMLSLS